MSFNQLAHSPLGQKSSYIDQYDKSLLFPIDRTQKRNEIGIDGELPFYGFDTWNAFELSWLDLKGKPVVALAKFDIPCESKCLVESKSFKLYLNSLNNTKFESAAAVALILKRDISEAAGAPVMVELIEINALSAVNFENFSGVCIDDQDITIDTYVVNPDFLNSDFSQIVSENLTSNLLKSNCLVTGQPDWGSVFIAYEGPKIDREGLLRYLVSFRNHNEFHEQCVERIFVDLMKHCRPQQLTVHARYTRRGGLDINPIRSTEKITPESNIRNIRQ